MLLESIDKSQLNYNLLDKDESLSVKKYADAYLRKKQKEKREEMDEQIKSNNRRFFIRSFEIFKYILLLEYLKMLI